jgi:MFS family permease
VKTTLRPVAAAFIVFGFYGGAWAVSVVDIEHTFDLTDAGLGLLLAAGILTGTMVAAIGGALSDRWGAGRTLSFALGAWSALLVLQAVSPHLGLFAVVFIAGTAAGGLIDVVMNVIAADALSHEPGKLVRFHGLFNAGAVLGAAATGVVVRLGASWRGVWVAVAVLAIATAVATRRSRVPEPPKVDHPSMVHALIELRHEGLVVLALVFGAAALVEGGIATWGVLYLRAHVGLGVLAGVSAYVVGESLATITRIAGGPVVGRLGTRRAILAGGLLASCGIAAEALSGNAALAATGLAVASVGISVVWPLLIAAVNNEARHPAVAIGGVTAAGYLGMVAGPPLVGALSAAFGLRTGLLTLSGIALFVALTPARVRAGASVAEP